MILRRMVAISITYSFLFGVANLPIKPIIANYNTTFAQAKTTLTSESSFFTENKGQWDPSILFVGNTSFGKVAFTKDAIFYQLVESSVSIPEKDESQLLRPRGSTWALI